jgi:hypothetical protein
MPNDDDLDGCELDFADAAEDDDTAELRPLFPAGEDDAGLAESYKALAGGSDAS